MQKEFIAGQGETLEEFEARKKILEEREKGHLKSLAYRLIQTQLSKDSEYAWIVHRTIGGALIKGGMTLEDAHYFSARVMKALFDVDTSIHECYPKDCKKP